jgi:diguanylate cyclase (GGDEF)-like protein/PAS domain S-box-containing protein
VRHDAGPKPLPSSAERFLDAHPAALVVVVDETNFTRRDPVGVHFRLGQFAEGPRIVDHPDALRDAIAAIRTAQQVGEAHTIVRLGGTSWHYSIVDLPGTDSLLTIFDEVDGLGELVTHGRSPADTVFRMRCDPASHILDVDRSFAESIGVPVDDLIGRPMRQFLHPKSRATGVQGWLEALEHGTVTRRVQFAGIDDDHSDGWYQVTCSFEDDAADSHVEVILVDVTTDVHAAELLREREADLRTMAETVPMGIFRATRTGRLLYQNTKLAEVFGLDTSDSIPVDQVMTLDDEPVLDALTRMLSVTPEAMLDTKLTVDDKVRYVRLRVQLVRSATGSLDIVGSAEDLTAEIARKVRLESEALTDPVTGAANRRSLELTLDEAIRGWSAEAPVAVLLCDLDGFKQVNDSLGHEAGDAVIAEVAARLQQMCRTGDMVARLGGDEFVVLARNMPNYDHAMEFAERILPALRKPFHFEDSIIELSGSIGVAVSAADSTVLGVLQMADHAMYEAKRSGRNQARPYHSPDSTHALSPLALRRDLRKAITADSLDLVFQPIYDFANDRFPAVESLLRWNHPTQGWISPSVVIPIAEQSGLIRYLGDWVISTAISCAAEVNRYATFDESIRIGVNISAIQLGRPELIDSVEAALDVHGVPPQSIAFELTESYLIDQVDHARETLAVLSDLGIKLAIDDFGTGYATLDYLLSMPIDAVKIDPTFTERLANPRALTMVKGLTSACRELDMEVIIEGVENEEQLEWAREAGATHAQGYHLGHPVGIDGLHRDLGERDVA